MQKKMYINKKSKIIKAVAGAVAGAEAGAVAGAGAEVEAVAGAGAGAEAGTLNAQSQMPKITKKFVVFGSWSLVFGPQN